MVHPTRREAEARPKVSVILLTYNHERFIAQALDSILMQQGDFNLHISIVEDCSSDGTRRILTDYKRRFPDLIELRLAEKNQNDNRAWGEAILAAQGKYVALLDGDDYWTSDRKLHSQVAFLENHPDCSICFHNVEIAYEDGRRALHNDPQQKAISTIDELWERNFIATCSTMFRQGLINSLPEWFWSMRFGDWPLHLLNAERGSIGYLDAVLAVYRRHASGLFSGTSEVRQLESVVQFYNEIGPWFKRAHGRSIRRGLAKHCWMLAQLQFAAGRGTESRRAFRQMLAARLAWRPERLKELTDFYLLLYWPRVKRMKDAWHRRRRVRGVG